MKLVRIALAIGATAFAVPALAQVYVQPHTRSDGTYVQGHYRSAPNRSQTDNWSTQGNTNPYTGRAGTQQPDYTPSWSRPSTSTSSSRSRSRSPY